MHSSKKNKAAEEEKGEVPEDLVIEIGLLLPVKSIGRLRCVSKRWNCILSTPEFVKSHFQGAPERILLDDREGSIHVITLDDDHNGGRSRAVKSGPTTYRSGLSCCNGLALLRVNFNLVVMNPVTLKRTILPYKKYKDDKIMYGLGYNSAEDDYKFVEFAYGQKLVKIFSLKTRCYKILPADDVSPYHPTTMPACFTLYADGRIYWHSCTNRVIIAFDLSTEKFEQVPLPVDLDSWNDRFYVRLAQLGGCFAIVDDSKMLDKQQINVWIMEKTGDWRKFIISDYPKSNDENWCEVISRLGEFEFVVQVRIGKLVAYNCETKVWRTLDIDGLPKDVFDHLNFRESLVCP